MLMAFFSEIFILLVKCSYVFMSENLATFMEEQSVKKMVELNFVKIGDVICIKYNFLKFAASNEKLGLFFSDKATVEYKNITGLS
jgi:hypothetical protein